MLNYFIGLFKRKQDQQLIEYIAAWYRSCSKVSSLCGDALHDQKIGSTDIGVILDKVDRELFALRNSTTDASNSLKRRDRALARRVVDATGEIYKLRNDTARFLIRCQGPSPTTFGQPEVARSMETYYQRALNEVGLNARRMHRHIEAEIHSLWQDLQEIIEQARH